MSNLTPPRFPDDSSSASPRAREEMAARIRQFHREQIRQIGQADMLKAYCHALSNWALNPNTEPYQIEMLFDEICHAARTEGLEDWEETLYPEP